MIITTVTTAAAVEAEDPEEVLEAEAATETTKRTTRIRKTEAMLSKLEASDICATWTTRYRWLEV